MVVEHSLLAGINGGIGLLTSPPVPTRHKFINLIIRAFARSLAARSGFDYDAVLARVLMLPDELADLFATPEGWATLAGIIDGDATLQPTLH